MLLLEMASAYKRNVKLNERQVIQSLTERKKMCVLVLIEERR